jgi:hypothetical protein
MQLAEKLDWKGLMVIVDVFDENINTLFKHGTHRDK